MSNLPTGEQLPDYPDDDRAPAPAALRGWLRSQWPKRWGGGSIEEGARLTGADASLVPVVASHVDLYENQIIADVLAALQAVGDAQVVKNGTYRMMVRDRAELEALSAFLANHGYARELVEADGHAGQAAATVIGGYARQAEAQAAAERERLSLEAFDAAYGAPEGGA